MQPGAGVLRSEAKFSARHVTVVEEVSSLAVSVAGMQDVEKPDQDLVVVLHTEYYGCESHYSGHETAIVSPAGCFVAHKLTVGLSPGAVLVDLNLMVAESQFGFAAQIVVALRVGASLFDDHDYEELVHHDPLIRDAQLLLDAKVVVAVDQHLCSHDHEYEELKYRDSPILVAQLLLDIRVDGTRSVSVVRVAVLKADALLCYDHVYEELVFHDSSIHDAQLLLGARLAVTADQHDPEALQAAKHGELAVEAFAG